jgi:uncharacterized protein YqiB (DUF1249 family)
MTIHRRYEPDPEALDRVVEILYRLLVEAPENHTDSDESRSIQVSDTTCTLQESEQ